MQMEEPTTKEWLGYLGCKGKMEQMGVMGLRQLVLIVMLYLMDNLKIRHKAT